MTVAETIDSMGKALPWSVSAPSGGLITNSHRTGRLARRTNLVAAVFLRLIERRVGGFD
jgi:hypothetical protein